VLTTGWVTIVGLQTTTVRRPASVGWMIPRTLFQERKCKRSSIVGRVKVSQHGAIVALLLPLGAIDDPRERAHNVRRRTSRLGRATSAPERRIRAGSRIRRVGTPLS